jgi:hypothetical protein
MLARRKKKSIKISEMVEGFCLVISTTGLNSPNTGGGGEDDDDDDDKMHAYVYYMLILLICMYYLRSLYLKLLPSN